MKKLPLYKITACAILTALALISFMIESLFPPILIPGARLGVSNVFILLSLILLGTPYAFITLTIKCLLGSIFAGNISAILYSLPAGLISLGIETIILLFYKKFSIVAVSTAGGILNLTVQNVAFCLITNSIEYLYYLPYLALIGSISVLTVGFIVYLIVKFLPDSITNKLFERRN